MILDSAEDGKTNTEKSSAKVAMDIATKATALVELHINAIERKVETQFGMIITQNQDTKSMLTNSTEITNQIKNPQPIDTQPSNAKIKVYL